MWCRIVFFFQAEDGIRDLTVTGVQTCALPICLLIGDKGKLFSPDDYGAKFFIKLKDEKELTDGKMHEAVKAIPVTIPRNEFGGEGGRRDGDRRHHLEWIAACKGGKPGYSNFEVAAYLTEIILLGCVSLRV